MSDKLADWTKGAEAIVYQYCAACGARQYFRRSFCAACGAPDPVEKRASGEGRSMRPRWSAAPRRRRRARMCPTTSCWSTPPEGFRMMAHGDNDLAIGDKVTARYRAICGKAGAVFREGEVMRCRHRT